MPVDATIATGGKLRNRMRVAAGFCVVVAISCVVLLFDQVQCWNTKDDYLFGYLVPLFVAFVVVERRHKIARIFTGGNSGNNADGNGDDDAGDDDNDEFSLPKFIKPGVLAPTWLEALFGAGTIFALLIFSTGALGSAIYGIDAFTTYQNTAGFIGICLGAAWFASAENFSGEANDLRCRGRLLLLLVFPIFVWLVSGPFTFLVDRQIKSLLLKNVTSTVVHLLGAVGFDLTQEANTIVLANGERVGVEDACSGVRSLTACLFTGSFLAAIFMRSVKKKVLFVAISIVCALLLNVMRTSSLTLWAIFNGANAIELDFWGHGPDSPEFSLGTVHDIVGWGAMIVTVAIMVVLVPIINFKFRKSAEEMDVLFVDEE